MPISGITVQVRKQELDKVRETIAARSDAEVVRTEGPYLVVVLEAATREQVKSAFQEIAQMPGVVTAEVAYYSEEV